MADLTGMMQAAAGAAGEENLYIEDVFSTYLYTGTGAAQTITNDIDLDGEGGLVWIKSRSDGTRFHSLYDTARGANLRLATNSTGAQQNDGAPSGLTFSSSGFVVADNVQTNESGGSLVSWTFRKAPKFFDVVTYTGTGANRTVAHNLGSVPGCIMVKRTDTTGAWQVYHRANTANPETDYLVLNTDAATADSDTRWNDTQPTSTVFSLGTEATVNASGGTYIAYLWAHDAGGFGDSGSENVVTCGSYTGNGSATGPVVTLNYEPQWLLVKQSSIAGANWVLVDNMRGFTADGGNAILYSNLTNDEAFASPRLAALATGFQPLFLGFEFNQSGQTYIYIAIRRGPMKTPTAGTEVYNAVAATGSGVIVTGFVTDAGFIRVRTSVGGPLWGARLTGTNTLTSTSAAAQSSFGNLKWDRMDGFWDLVSSYFGWGFRRAPGFFDVCCYTGTGSDTTFAHNLAAVPELIIAKTRSVSGSWYVYSAALGATKYLRLNATSAEDTAPTVWNASPTSAVFSVGSSAAANESGVTFVAYLFASLAGISKVGTYTGTGTTLAIDCGFSAGARFVLIKRTDSTGDWYFWDSTRGIVAGDDPYLLLNSTAVEVTNTDYIDPLSSGFEISSTAPAAINASGGTFVFFAVA
jgi:hypothetical protein